MTTILFITKPSMCSFSIAPTIWPSSLIKVIYTSSWIIINSEIPLYLNLYILLSVLLFFFITLCVYGFPVLNFRGWLINKASSSSSFIWKNFKWSDAVFLSGLGDWSCTNISGLSWFTKWESKFWLPFVCTCGRLVCESLGLVSCRWRTGQSRRRGWKWGWQVATTSHHPS